MNGMTLEISFKNGDGGIKQVGIEFIIGVIYDRESSTDYNGRA